MQEVGSTDSTQTCEVKLLADYTNETRISSVEVNNISYLSDVVFDASAWVLQRAV